MSSNEAVDYVKKPVEEVSADATSVAWEGSCQAGSGRRVRR